MLGDTGDTVVTKTTSDVTLTELMVQFQRQTYYQSVTTQGWEVETQKTVGIP